MHNYKQQLLLPDLVIIVWSLYISIQLVLHGVVTASALLYLFLFLSCYYGGRLVNRLAIVYHIATGLLIAAAALCYFYTYYDITVFQYPTLVSVNSSVFAIEMAIAATACLALIKTYRSWVVRTSLGLATCIFVLLVFFLASRAAFIALIGGVFYIYYNDIKRRHARNVLLVFAGALLVMTMVLTLMVKVDSSAGRWFIWKNSGRLFQREWLTGVGPGLFNRSYNHVQADYFAHHSLYEEEARLADNGFYAFNEWLQVGVEQGIVGLLLFLVFTFCVLKFCWKRIKQDEKLPGALLISIGIACLFSYPLHNWVILSMTGFCCGYLLKDARVVWTFNMPRRVGFASLCVLISAVVGNAWVHSRSIAKFARARELMEEGAKTEAYQIAKTQVKALRTRPSFSLFYMNLLYETGRLQEAIDWFNTVHVYQCSQQVHTLAGKCYAETGAAQLAEQHLLTSLYLTPYLLRSRMDLADFYDQQGDTSKAKFWANEVINYSPKVNSALAELLKQQAANYIANGHLRR